jgi:hypothetical protein
VSDVTISASNVVEDQLPAPAVYKAARTFLSSKNSNDILDENFLRDTVILEEGRMQAQIMVAGKESIKRCGIWQHNPPALIFISQVFYAYSFDFNVGNKVGYAAALGVQVTGSTSSSAAAAAPNANPSATASATPTAAASASSSSTTPAQTTPWVPMQIQPTYSPTGGSLHIEYGRTGNLVLKESFERPLAFGFIGDVRFSYADARALHDGHGAATVGAVAIAPAGTRQLWGKPRLFTANYLFNEVDAAGAGKPAKGVAPPPAPPAPLNPPAQAITPGCRDILLCSFSGPLAPPITIPVKPTTERVKNLPF